MAQERPQRGPLLHRPALAGRPEPPADAVPEHGADPGPVILGLLGHGEAVRRPAGLRHDHRLHEAGGERRE
eukprot:11099082-Lingulodinium_polyedra.AAC.1